jgi:hypothetical protein
MATFDAWIVQVKKQLWLGNVNIYVDSTEIFARTLQLILLITGQKGQGIFEISR